MRTTLTIDADVEQLLQREIRRTGRSMKAVVNDALRLGLGMHGKPPRAPRYKVKPHDFGIRPGVDRDRFNQLVDELEAEEFARQGFAVKRRALRPAVNRRAARHSAPA